MSIKKKLCMGCWWGQVKNPLPFCVNKQNNSDEQCEFYATYKYDDKTQSFECWRCKRDRDPGKCWYCGADDFPQKKG